jgi:hypothetical protein
LTLLIFPRRKGVNPRAPELKFDCRLAQAFANRNTRCRVVFGELCRSPDDRLPDHGTKPQVLATAAPARTISMSSRSQFNNVLRSDRIDINRPKAVNAHENPSAQ